MFEFSGMFLIVTLWLLNSAPDNVLYPFDNFIETQANTNYTFYIKMPRDQFGGGGNESIGEVRHAV